MRLPNSAPRRIWLLGGLRLEQNGTPVALPAGKAQLLLARLALPPLRPQRREVLADLLWPEAPPDRGPRNLSNTLYQLQQHLSPDWLLVDGQKVGLHPEGVWVDAQAFAEGCAVPDHQPEALRRWQDAAALYTGDLLPELYDDWVLGPQVALREQYLNTLIKIGLALETAQQYGEAQLYFAKGIAHDPLREEAYWGVMRTLTRQGRLAEALNSYRQLTQQLEQELGVPPSHKSQQLADRIQQELILASTKPQTTASQRPRLPFVGRLSERQQFLTRLPQAAAGRGGLFMLMGEPGMGKTRLLTELAEAAAWRGWQIAWGRGQEFTLPSAYAPLTAALNEALPLPRLQQLASLISPARLRLLARLVPAAQELLPPATYTPEADQSRLAQTIYQVLRGLQQIAPHLLILDDVQWASPSLWPLLVQIEPYLMDLSVLLVLSGRSTELLNQPDVWSTWQEWHKRGYPLVSLTGLNQDEMEQLAAAYQSSPLPTEQMTRLNQASGGNPLLALSLLETRALDQVAELPASLLDLLHQQLAHLSPLAQQALQAAAVLGFEFAYPIWAELLRAYGFPTARLPQIAGELERARLILLKERGYWFAHDMLRAAVYEQLTPQERRQWHGYALAVLSQQPSQNALALLYHAEQAAAPAQIAQYALLAGEQALENFTYPAALAYFTQALRALPPEQIEQRYRAVRGRLRATVLLADRSQQQADLIHLQGLVRQLQSPRYQAEFYQYQAEFFWQTGQWELGEQAGLAGLPLAHAAADDSLIAALQTILGQISRDKGVYAQANAWFEQAEQQHQKSGNQIGQGYITQMRGVIAQRLGDYPQAITLSKRALALVAAANDPSLTLRFQSNLAVAYWMSSDYAQARDLFTQILRLSRETGDRRVEATALGNLGALAGLVADFAASADYITQALRLERLTQNRTGIAAALTNLGKTISHLGQPSQALVYIDEALTINREMGRRRGEGYSWHIRGSLLMQMERYVEAEAALQQAQVIRQELGEQDNVLYTQADLALLYVLMNQLPQAERILIPMLAGLEMGTVSAEIRQAIHYTAYRYYHAWGDGAAARPQLLLAREAMAEIAAPLSPVDRERFLRQLPLNQQIQDALAAWQRPQTVQLVRADVPLGRKLTPEDYVTVTWTVASLEDEEIADKTERRRFILARLLREAAAQTATPTDDDLAQALGVSRRTIIRDMKAIPLPDTVFPTRGR